MFSRKVDYYLEISFTHLNAQGLNEFCCASSPRNHAETNAMAPRERHASEATNYSDQIANSPPPGASK
jgi:hypothetical protein